MPEPKALKQGDRCPNCGGELESVPSLTKEEHARAYDRENPQSINAFVDTAAPDVRADLGELNRCSRCGYQTRFKEDSGRDKPRSGNGRDRTRDDARDDQGDRERTR